MSQQYSHSHSHSHSHRMQSISDIWRFIHAGRAVFTLVSTETQKRYTFQVAQQRKVIRDEATNVDKSQLIPGHFWVRTLGAGSRWLPIGKLTDDEWHSRRESALAKPIAAFGWFWRGLRSAQESLVPISPPQLPTSVEFWHEGQCGRCGRELTVPESIKSGIGPECAKREEAQRLLEQLL